MSNQDYSYDVALSFAGEDRKYAEELAQVLKARDIEVFYDKYEEATLWGKDLYTHLSDVYQRQARFCVMFISQHYAQKLWTNHERSAAQARAFGENKEYILPLRLDHTNIPGILPTIGYLTWSNADSIANAIVRKLERLERPLPNPNPGNGGSNTRVEQTSFFLLDACFRLARMSIGVGLTNRYNKSLYSLLKKLPRTELAGQYTYNADNLFNRVNYSYDSWRMDSYIPDEISYIKGQISSYQDLLNNFASEQAFVCDSNTDSKKEFSTVYYKTYCLLIRKSWYFYKDYLNNQEELQPYVELINSEAEAEQWCKELGFQSFAELNEYFCPTVASINDSLGETTLLLYRQLLERGELRRNKVFADGFPYWDWVEVANALYRSKWAEFEYDNDGPVKLRLNSVGRQLLQRKLDAIRRPT